MTIELKEIQNIWHNYDQVTEGNTFENFIS